MTVIDGRHPDVNRRTAQRIHSNVGTSTPHCRPRVVSEVSGNPEGLAEPSHVMTVAVGKLVTLMEVGLLFG